MTTFRFLGFPTGSAVAMSLNKGPRTETVNVPEWKMSGRVEIAVLAEQAAAVAPFQINLEAQVDGFGVAAGATPSDYDPQFHDIEYIWSIEKYVDGILDASYATSAYSAVSELPTHMKVKGTKYGKTICHVFGKEDVAAGQTSTFRFIVTAIDLATGETVTSAPLEKTVAHPDDFFNPAETFIVRISPQIDHPATSNPYFREMGDAAAAISQSSLTKARICVQRGFSYPRLRSFPDNVTGQAILVDTWGIGDASIGANNAGAFRLFAGLTGACRSVQIDGFKIFKSSESRAFSAAGGSDLFDDICVTVSNFVLEGVAIGGERVGGTSSGWVAFHNLSNTKYTYCGFLGLLDENAKGLAFIGSEISDDPKGNSDNIKDDGSAGGGGWAMRLATSSHFYVSNCHFFTKQGWFVNIPGISTTQPNCRLTISDGTHGIFSNSIMEGSGQTILRMSSDVTGIANILVERCMFVSAYGLQQFMETNVPATIRNNMFVMGPGISPTVYAQLERVSSNGGAGGAQPIKFYSNTLTNLQGGSTSAISVSSGSWPVIDANNVMHQPYKDTPVVAGTFSLSETYAPKQDGYSTLKAGEDPVYVCIASVATAFTPGEIVTGSVSEVSKTYVGTRNRFRDDGMLAFEMAVTTANLNDTPGFERFDSADVLSGSLGGFATMNSMYSSQPHDTSMFAVATIPDTAMPAYLLPYKNPLGGFTPGATLTGGTTGATAMICQVHDGGATGRLWLRDVNGAFADGEPLTDSFGGSAHADGEQQSAGTGALWLPTEGNPALGAALNDPVALTDFFGNRRPPYPSKGAFEAAF